MSDSGYVSTRHGKQIQVTGHGIDLGWIGPGRHDYRQFDTEVQTILEANPAAYLLPRLAVSAPKWWLDTHPDDRTVYDDGSYGGPSYQTSMASRVWLNDAQEAMVNLIRHVQAMPCAHRFIGYHLVGGVNEWFYSSRGYPDFSPASIHSFRAWLKEHYAGDVSALRLAWKQPGVQFETATVPAKQDRLNTDVDLLRDPSRSRQVSDYYQFFSEVDADAVIQFCRVGKQVTGNASIFSAFYGYQINATGGACNGTAPWHWGHQALGKVRFQPAGGSPAPACTHFERMESGLALVETTRGGVIGAAWPVPALLPVDLRAIRELAVAFTKADCCGAGIIFVG